MYSIILIILLTIIVITLFDKSKNKNKSDSKIKNIFNSTKIIIFVVSIIILIYSFKITNITNVNKLPEIYTKNIDF